MRVIKNADAVIAGTKPADTLGIAAPDPRTVTIALKAATPYFLALLASDNSALPVHRASVEANGDRWTEVGRMVSNGAYTLEDWRPNQQISVLRNRCFHAVTSVTIERVVFHPVADASEEVRRFKFGHLDSTDEVPQDRVKWISLTQPRDFWNRPFLAAYYDAFKLTAEPLKGNRDLRKALALAIAFGFAVVTDTQTVHFEYVDVPESIAMESGYTSAVVITKLTDEMQEVERQAFTKAEARKVELHADKQAASVPGEFLGVTPLIRVVQESAHLIPFSFSGAIVRHHEQVEFTLRGFDSHHNKTKIVKTVSIDHMGDLIQATAYEAMRGVNPYILAAYQFKRDRLSRDFTATLEILQREIAGHDSKYGPWLHNLWGMVLYQQNDRAGTLHRFEAATKIDPTFADVYSGWAEVLSAQGRKEDAAKMTAQALRLAPTEVVYTENLIGAVQNLPATATGLRTMARRTARPTRPRRTVPRPTDAPHTPPSHSGEDPEMKRPAPGAGMATRAAGPLLTLLMALAMIALAAPLHAQDKAAPAPAEPTTVKVGMYVTQLLDFDMSKRSFYAAYWLSSCTTTRNTTPTRRSR